MPLEFKRENIYKLSALCNMRKKENVKFFSYDNFYLNFSISITSAIISFQLENKKEWTKSEYIDFLKYILQYEYKYGFLKNFWISEKYIDLSIENTIDTSKNFGNNLTQLISLLEYHHKCTKKWVQDSELLSQRIEKFHTPKIRKILLKVFRDNIPSFFNVKINDSHNNNLKTTLEYFIENDYRIWKFNIYGLDRKWYRRDGFKQEKTAYNFHKNGTTYDDEWFNSLGYDKSGYNRSGYNLEGLNRDGYRINGYDAFGYDRSGYNSEGYDKQGFDKNGYNSKWFDRNGFTKEGYNSLGFDKDGYDKDGYDKNGFNKTTGLHKNGNKYDYQGYDVNWYNNSGYNRDWFNKLGYNKSWFDKNGLDRGWFDINGYNIDGFNREWFDRSGYNKKGDYNKEFDLRLQWIKVSQNAHIPQEESQNNYSNASQGSQVVTIRIKDEYLDANKNNQTYNATQKFSEKDISYTGRFNQNGVFVRSSWGMDSIFSLKWRMWRSRFIVGLIIRIVIFISCIVFLSSLYRSWVDENITMWGYLILLIIGACSWISDWARRCHDLWQSWWSFLIVLIPIIGLIYVLYLMSAKWEDKANQYGPITIYE